MEAKEANFERLLASTESATKQLNSNIRFLQKRCSAVEGQNREFKVIMEKDFQLCSRQDVWELGQSLA